MHSQRQRFEWEGGFNPPLPLTLFPCRCLRRRFKHLAFSAPVVNNPSGSSPFCTYISLYLVYCNVLCMIQTLIYIYGCNTVKITTKTSRWLIPLVSGALCYDWQTVICLRIRALKIIALDKIFTMILSGCRPYKTSRSFCYKTYTSLLSTVH